MSHNDVKPGNICCEMRNGETLYKLHGFGSLLHLPAEGTQQSTPSTPAYCAPEVAHDPCTREPVVKARMVAGDLKAPGGPVCSTLSDIWSVSARPPPPACLHAWRYERCGTILVVTPCISAQLPMHGKAWCCSSTQQSTCGACTPCHDG